MMPEAGNILLCLALSTALLQTVYGLWGVQRGDRRMMVAGQRLSVLLFALIAGAFLILITAFVNNDFTVMVVVNHSSVQLPVWYRVAAAWGGHEGSLMLWILMMSGWTCILALFTRTMPPESRARVIAVMGLLCAAFLLFILFTSNPFARTLPDFPAEGRDLNPMLQDPGQIFHPPLLYMGYTGFAITFAFAVAALLGGQMESRFIRQMRPWVTAAWVFLTLGILFGSAWAYYELGWGGWWGWDPVENASLMPWLTGTALLHSIVMAEQRATFKIWSLLLAVCTFSLCLLGTFLVRSNVLISVHAFTSDPSKGLFILLIMALFAGGALLLFALRGQRIRSRTDHALWSRESLLLGNNLLLLTAMLVVLLGTLLPLIHRLAGLGSISVGEPFFSQMFFWLGVPFALLAGIGPLVRRKRDTPPGVTGRAVTLVLLSLLLPVLFVLWREGHIVVSAVAGLAMACWVLLMTTAAALRHRRHGKPFTLRYAGMLAAHAGLAVLITGIAFSQHYSRDRSVRMSAGESTELRDYRFTLRGIHDITGPNYHAEVGVIDVTHHGRSETTLYAEKRYYQTAANRMTEAAVDGGLTRDLYVTMGETLGDGAQALHLRYKPFVRWIWAGGLLMAAGGVLCLIPPRRRMTTEEV